MKAIYGLAAFSLLTALAGCVDETEMDASREIGGSMTAMAENACLNEVANQTRASGVTVINSDYSEAGTQVTLRVPGAEQPWSCLASNDGEVEQVQYMGEG